MMHGQSFQDFKSLDLRRAETTDYWRIVRSVPADGLFVFPVLHPVPTAPHKHASLRLVKSIFTSDRDHLYVSSRLLLMERHPGYFLERIDFFKGKEDGKLDLESRQ